MHLNYANTGPPPTARTTDAEIGLSNIIHKWNGTTYETRIVPAVEGELHLTEATRLKTRLLRDKPDQHGRLSGGNAMEIAIASGHKAQDLHTMAAIETKMRMKLRNHLPQASTAEPDLNYPS